MINLRRNSKEVLHCYCPTKIPIIVSVEGFLKLHSFSLCGYFTWKFDTLLTGFGWISRVSFCTSKKPGNNTKKMIF